MSTMGILSTGYRAARAAAKQHRGERRTRTARAGRLTAAVAEHGLAVLGLTCFVAAAAMVAVPLGLAVAGAGFFILELRAGE
jgi:hypothetical protein